MVKVIVAKGGPRRSTPKQGAIAKRRVRAANGKLVTHFWVNTNSDTFNDDLTAIFKLNVGAARQANTAVFGSPDGFKKDAGKMAERFEKIMYSGQPDGISKK
jgi:hypothetical protein